MLARCKNMNENAGTARRYVVPPRGLGRVLAAASLAPWGSLSSRPDCGSCMRPVNTAHGHGRAGRCPQRLHVGVSQRGLGLGLGCMRTLETHLARRRRLGSVPQRWRSVSAQSAKPWTFTPTRICRRLFGRLVRSLATARWPASWCGQTRGRRPRRIPFEPGLLPAIRWDRNITRLGGGCLGARSCGTGLNPRVVLQVWRCQLKPPHTGMQRVHGRLLDGGKVCVGLFVEPSARRELDSVETHARRSTAQRRGSSAAY